MKARLTLAMTGRIGPYTVIADEALEQLADRLRSTENPSVTIRLPNGDIEPARIDPASVVLLKLGDNRQAIVADVEIPDTIGAELPPLLQEPVDGKAATEQERAEQMPVLEAQLQDAENLQEGQ